jgi:glycosyltransferase involved in cell wall biosynthesis
MMDTLPRPTDSRANEPRRDRLAGGRICIVTGELAGPDFNGGIGTANRGLALALRQAGHTVDVLYTRVENGQPFAFRGSFAEQVAAFRAAGVNLLCISHDGQWDHWLAKSFRVMEALAARAYDIVFFDDTHGTAYYTMLAKKTGSPELAGTRLVVVAHSATQWICELNQSPVSGLNEIRLLEMERRGVELADHLIAPSAYILEKYRSYGWALPERTLVRPNILPFSTERPVPPRKSTEVGEIVFFGRLERRKGLWMFCEALDRLKHELGNTKVTFLGKFTAEDGESTGLSLLRRSLNWPFSVNLLYSYDREQALAYLKGGQRLAVLPSIEDNSPCAILECLIEGIPLLASSGSGGQELIDKADHSHCLFEPTADALTERLRHVIKNRATSAQPSFSPLDNVKQTMRWVSDVLEEIRSEGSWSPETTPRKQRDTRPSLSQTLLLFGTEGMAPTRIREHAEQAAALHKDASIIVLADDIPESERQSQQGRIRFAQLAEFDAIALALAQNGGLAVIGRLDQQVEPAVLSRAETCFRSSDIDAVTVMKGHRVAGTKPEQSFVCFQADSLQPKVLRSGNLQALLPLWQDAGEGVLVLRSECLAIARQVSHRDEHRCRLKVFTHYVHELLLKLTSEGRRFELLPDCFIAESDPTEGFETSQFPRVALEHVRQARRLSAGSEEMLLAKLTIDSFSAKAARQGTHELMAKLISRAGESIMQPESYWPPSNAFATYARVAHACGRPELALSLLAQAALENNGFLRNVAASPDAIAAAVARSIDLAALVDAGQFAGLNLDHPWSLKVEDNRSTIEIHPNSQNEGQAAIMFPALAIMSPARFTAELALASTAKGPVRYEMDIQLPAPHGDAFRCEWDIHPGQSKLVEVQIPFAFSSVCDVLLATRMTRRTDSTEGAHAKWRQPGFSPF